MVPAYIFSISILAVLADRDDYYWPVFANIGISILAVLADRDPKTYAEALNSIQISILAVLADRDLPFPL